MCDKRQTQVRGITLRCPNSELYRGIQNLEKRAGLIWQIHGDRRRMRAPQQPLNFRARHCCVSRWASAIFAGVILRATLISIVCPFDFLSYSSCKVRLRPVHLQR